MIGDTMLVECGYGLDEDGEYLTLSTVKGEVRLHYVKLGEERANGFIQVLPVHAFARRKDGSIAITLITCDRRARLHIYRVSEAIVMLEAEFESTD